MILDSVQPANGVNLRDESPENEKENWWGACAVLLVADRTRGSTHRFFRDWRFEVVTGTGHGAPGTVLFAVPIDQRQLAASGWHYEMRRLDERPGDFARDTAAFSWAATASPDSPDPFAAALGRAQAWLSAARDAGRPGSGIDAAGAGGLQASPPLGAENGAVLEKFSSAVPSADPGRRWEENWESEGGAMAPDCDPGRHRAVRVAPLG